MKGTQRPFVLLPGHQIILVSKSVQNMCLNMSNTLVDTDNQEYVPRESFWDGTVSPGQYLGP
jgi:hypothetical protein